MRSIESLLVNNGMGRGSSWSSLDLETLESDVSSGRSVGQAAVFVNVLQQSCEETRRHDMSVVLNGV